MSSLQAFYIEFDRPNAIYMPGEIVSGNIIVNVLKQKITRELKLSAKGEAYVRWNEHITERDSDGRTRTNTVSYTAKETYFHVTCPVMGKSERYDGMMHIPAGLNRYPFRIQLPVNIPCSFEHTYGYIRYTIKAIIDRPWKFDHQCKAAFTVINIFDLNIHRERCMSLHVAESKSFYNCFCCFDGTITVHITVPTTGFVPGQYIEATLDLNNTSNVDILKISAKLEQFIEFHGKDGFHARIAKKRDKLTVTEMQKVGPFAKYAVINLQLYVPPIPPSNLEFCNIIDLRYFFYIIIHVSGLHLNFSKKYPILIGTLPLRTAPPMILSPPVIQTDFQSTSNEIAPGPLGFTAVAPSVLPNAPLANNYFDAPPSYEECCMSTVHSIKEHDESEYVYGANKPFAPRYPVFNFPASH